jgi:hypothetical protein
MNAGVKGERQTSESLSIERAEPYFAEPARAASFEKGPARYQPGPSEGP